MNLFQTLNFNCVNYRNKARYQNYQTTVFERTECVTNFAPAADSDNSRLERNSLQRSNLFSMRSELVIINLSENISFDRVFILIP